MIPDKKIDFWIEKDYNVLLIGRHGVGKTTVIKKAFDRNNIKALYFSSSTMDPWVDLIGVPKVVKDDEGIDVLDLIRPKSLVHSEVEAIFFDEFNRAHKKIRNACLELIQFKSINGNPFPNLRMVWAAINPDESSGIYDVDPLDLAQQDRFHIIYTCPNEPDADYFKAKHGSETQRISFEWWKRLEPATQLLVSPRRLDYALSIYDDGGDLKDVLPVNSNVNDLIAGLDSVSIQTKFEKVLETDNSNSKEQLAKLIISNKASQNVALSMFFNGLTNDKALTKSSRLYQAASQEVRNEWEAYDYELTSAIVRKLLKTDKDFQSFIKIERARQPDGYLIEYCKRVLADKDRVGVSSMSDQNVVKVIDSLSKKLNTVGLDLMYTKLQDNEAFKDTCYSKYAKGLQIPAIVMDNNTSQDVLIPLFWVNPNTTLNTSTQFIKDYLNKDSPHIFKPGMGLAQRKTWLRRAALNLMSNCPVFFSTTLTAEQHVRFVNFVYDMVTAMKGLRANTVYSLIGVDKNPLIARLMLESLAFPTSEYSGVAFRKHMSLLRKASPAFGTRHLYGQYISRVF